MRILATLVLALALSSCATWTQTYTKASTVRWVVAPLSVIQSFPGCDRFDIFACAVNFTHGMCLVFATAPREETPQYVIEHEEKHCDGFSHDEKEKV